MTFYKLKVLNCILFCSTGSRCSRFNWTKFWSTKLWNFRNGEHIFWALTESETIPWYYTWR